MLPHSASHVERTSQWHDMHVEQKAATLAAFVDSLQERGQYTFSRDEALSALGSTPIALKRAAERLKAKRRLAAPRRGFYTIVPLEYRQSGSPPAASFIDQLMQFHGTLTMSVSCRRRRGFRGERALIWRIVSAISEELRSRLWHSINSRFSWSVL